MFADLLDGFVGSLIGLAVGDALGAPFEFKKHEFTLTLGDKEIFEEASKNGLLRFTDDTLMMMALARSIIDAGGFDPLVAAEEYYRWYLSGDWRGIGITVSRALSSYGEKRIWWACGVIDKYAAGNGTAMRIAPLALYDYRASLRRLYMDVRDDSVITHFNEEAISGAFAVALAIKYILGGVDKEELLERILDVFELFGIRNNVYEKLRLVGDLLRSGISFSEEIILKIGNSGYVAESVPLAVFIFLASDSFEETVLRAVKSGEDTDTHAAIAGAIAGAYYGYSGIPRKYAEILEERETIVELARNLYKLANVNK
ncbi:MAG: ADP-ribosylglycohydrolase family protein [Candidatus Njordarchaeia archaeon]